MKPDYKNWIPKGMLFSLIAGTVLSLALLLVFGVFGIGVSGKLRVVLGVVFGIAFVVCAKYTQWCVYAYVRYYTSPGWLTFILLFTTLMGFLGCMVGSRLIRRHFQKAGVL